MRWVASPEQSRGDPLSGRRERRSRRSALRGKPKSTARSARSRPTATSSSAAPGSGSSGQGIPYRRGSVYRCRCGRVRTARRRAPGRYSWRSSFPPEVSSASRGRSHRSAVVSGSIGTEPRRVPWYLLSSCRRFRHHHPGAQDIPEDLDRETPYPRYRQDGRHGSPIRPCSPEPGAPDVPSGESGTRSRSAALGNGADRRKEVQRGHFRRVHRSGRRVRGHPPEGARIVVRRIEPPATP